MPFLGVTQFATGLRSRRYNTTADVLAFLGDPVNRRFFARPDFRVIISWCFKGCGGAAPCDGSAGSYCKYNVRPVTSGAKWG